MAKRRANGEGSIRKRADGRWEGRYTAGYAPATGKRVIKNVLGKTQAEVKAKLKLAVEQAQQVDAIRADDYDAGFTLRTYTHATRQAQDKAAEKMGNFMTQMM